MQVYNPEGLPIKGACPDEHPKVQELRTLSIWSEGQFWCCPEQHGEPGAFACTSANCVQH